MKKMSTVRKTSLWRFNNSTGTFKKSFATGLGLLRVVFPFNTAIFVPQDGNVDILDRYRTVLDLFATNQPLEILP